MTNSAGAIQAQYQYDPYGRATKLQSSQDADFQYAGYYMHAPSGLNLTMFRAYNPSLGRWISRDPIGERGGINLFAYVGNMPTLFVDSLGLIGDDYVNRGPEQFAPMSDESFFNAMEMFMWAAFPEGKAVQLGAAPVLRGMAKMDDFAMCIRPNTPKRPKWPLDSALNKEKMRLLENGVPVSENTESIMMSIRGAQGGLTRLRQWVDNKILQHTGTYPEFRPWQRTQYPPIK